MMRLARLKPPIAVAAALILATAGVAVQGRQKPAAQGAQEQSKVPPPPINPPGVPLEAREPARIAPPPAAGKGGAVPDLAEANRALARDQLAVIDTALAMLHAMAINARISLADPSFSIWGRRKLETLRKAGASKAEIIAALEGYIADMKEEEVIAQARQQANGGALLELYDGRFRRMEAETWLNEEKAR